ncbi:MAG: hypothetical protein WC924_05555 [Candidatus Gracilibacteria bacterium]
MVVDHDIDGDALTGVATGRAYDTEKALLPLAPPEKVEYAHLITALRSDPRLLREAGDPLLLTQYALITQFLSLGEDPVSLMGRFLPPEEFATFKGRFIEDQSFRDAFDEAYHAHRLTSVRGEACTRGKERVLSEVGIAQHRIKSWLGWS